MAAPCYDGPNPIDEQDRYAIWKWAKTEGGVDAGVPVEQVYDAINQKFYGGQGKPEWITDILSGRKTPFRAVAKDMWKKQYNRRVVTQQASEISRLAGMGPVGKLIRRIWTAPRSVAVAGHGVVFPITHAGDLAFRPASWGTFIKGTMRTYRGAFSKAYTGRILAGIERDSMFDTALQSGVDVGKNSHPSGLISRSYHGPAQRAWDMLTVMRFELWKKQMSKFVKPGMSSAEVLDIGKNLAEWANHATGSATGPISKAGGEVLFGPKLTQSKLNRLALDPVKTGKTFANWAEATPGERAVAMTRLSGATQFLVTNLGFLAVNAGVLAWLGQKEKVNWTDPLKGDYFAFKGGGLEGYIPGMHTEVRTLAKLLATAFASRKELRGESKFSQSAKIVGQYGQAKLTPAIQRIMEVGFGQNWEGRPLPWSSDPGTAKRPRLTTGEFLAEIGPIPLSGPIGYVYDQLKKDGANPSDAMAVLKGLIVYGLSPKGLIITGIGAPGVHIREDYPAEQKVAPKRIPGMPRAVEGRKLKATSP